MARYLIKKLEDDEKVALEDVDHVFTSIQIINRVYRTAENMDWMNSDQMLELFTTPVYKDEI